jgi:hypothetical protein
VVKTLTVALDRALEETRTGDVWLFRGHSGPDRAIQTLSNSPVNHVGMTVAIEDLPPLMWHAELGDKLTDVWTGTNHRGVQLNDAREAVERWLTRYGQRCWLRQLTPGADREQENRLLRVIARMDGTPFPAHAAVAAGSTSDHVRLGARNSGRGRLRSRINATTQCGAAEGPLRIRVLRGDGGSYLR